VPDSITIGMRGKAHGQIRPPGSKSLTNRALICGAMAEGESTLRGVLDSEDTHVMLQGLGQLGLKITHNPKEHLVIIEGCGGKLVGQSADLFVANSGTTIRFLSAMCAACHGTFRLHGIDRMHQRPIGDLVDALKRLGVDAQTESPLGCPPIRLKTSGMTGGTISIRGDVSSQFLSGLLMAGPYCQNDLKLQVEGELVSRPYVDMTLAVMQAFGANVQVNEEENVYQLAAPHRYQGTNYTIEPDASAASYFWAAAAITGGDVTVLGLGPEALQGDVGFVKVLAEMGCFVEAAADSIRVQGGPLKGVDIDMNAISDTVQTLASVALFAEGPTRVRGVAHNRHKETDRIGDLARELRKFGAEVVEHEDGLTITPAPEALDPEAFHGVEIETYNDHRMAMSLALPGLRLPGVKILNPGCTVKTYPNYFEDLATLF
jgi:3-phosphoshikimate 1-carboxyvinyltransferase